MKAIEQKIKAEIRWVDKGNTDSKEVFLIVKTKPSKLSILALKDNEGGLATKKKELKKVCCSFLRLALWGTSDS